MSSSNTGLDEFDRNYKGPPTKRKLTDWIFLPLFFVFCIIWYFIGSYAISNGDIEKLLAPVDSDGQKCGIDNAVSDKPYLFYFNLTQCVTILTFLSSCPTKQICMKDCPSNTWFATDLLSEPITDWKAQVQDKLICISDTIKKKVDTIDKLKDVITSNQCASYYFKSYPGIANRCIPHLDEIKERINKTIDGVNVTENENYQLLQNYLTVFTNLWKDAKNDMKRCWPVITYFLGISIIVALFYIMTLSYFARIIIWTTVIIVMVLLAFCAVMSYGNYTAIEQDVQFKWTFNSLFKEKSTWLVLTITSLVALLVFFLLSIFLRNRIQLAFLIISESSKAVNNMKVTLLFPILPFLLKLCVVYWFVLVLLNLQSIGDAEYRVNGLSNDTDCRCKTTDGYYKDNVVCVPRKFESECRSSSSSDDSMCEIAICKYYHRILPQTIIYYQLLNLFGLLWGIYFMSGWNKFVLAYCYAKWYWTPGKKPFFALTTSIYLSVRYHLGTVTVGSFVLACIAFIRSVLLYIQSTLKRYDDKLLCQCAFWALNCLFWCLHKFLIFLTGNAYIMSAIYGGGFFSSAGRAFNLILRNIIRVVVIDKIVGFLLFVGKVSLVLGITTVSYFIFMNITPPLDNAYTFIALTGIVSLIVAHLFFGVYKIAVDTLFLCFLVDGELNDGSKERPYYMSKKLGKLLHAVKGKGKRN